MEDRELSREEIVAFQNLKPEAQPSELLEERVVRALRADGILEPVSRRRVGGPWLGAAAAAAAVVIFASGAGFGHWMGARSTAETFLAVREQDATQLAQSIQEAGSAYVRALAALSELRSPLGDASERAVRRASTNALDQGREVALGSLYAATFELARLSPGDEDVLRILEILGARRARAQGQGRREANKSVVWF
jgi:hypothetical protein